MIRLDVLRKDKKKKNEVRVEKFNRFRAEQRGILSWQQVWSCYVSEVPGSNMNTPCAMGPLLISFYATFMHERSDLTMLKLS